MNQAAFQELGDLLEDRHSGHRINPHGSPDCPRNYELHGPRPTRHLNRNLLISPRPQSPHKRLRISLVPLPQHHFATMPLCHIKDMP